MPRHARRIVLRKGHREQRAMRRFEPQCRPAFGNLFRLFETAQMDVRISDVAIADGHLRVEAEDFLIALQGLLKLAGAHVLDRQIVGRRRVFGIRSLV